MERDLQYFINKFNNMPDDIGRKATSHDKLWVDDEIDDFLSLIGQDVYKSAFDFVCLSGILGSEKAAAQHMLAALAHEKAA